MADLRTNEVGAKLSILILWSQNEMQLKDLGQIRN